MKQSGLPSWAALFTLKLRAIVIDPAVDQGEKKVAIGSVKWFSDQKGFGFIVPDDGGKDLFVHHSNITMDGFRTLQEGQKVEYEVSEGRKGPEATEVRAA